CRACMSDADCMMGHCDTQTDAQSGSCVECNGDGDCTGANQVCQAHACITQDPANGPGPRGTARRGVGSGAGAGAGAPGGPRADPAEATGVNGGCACRATTGDDRTPSSLLALGALGIVIAASRRRRDRI